MCRFSHVYCNNLGKVKEVFGTYDVMKEDSIMAFEIINALRSLDVNVTQEEIDEVVKENGIAGTVNVLTI